MIVYILAFLAGLLTIASPCILPILPIVLTRTDQPFRRSGLPMLAGMAVTFAVVASLAAVGGGWAVRANQYGRWVALALVTVFGLALMWPALAARLATPATWLGERVRASRAARDGSPRASLLLGVATGLLWVPCAGPVLGLILATAALQGPGMRTTVLLLVFAIGAATSLAVALLVGGRALAALRRTLGPQEWLRRVAGATVVAGAVLIAAGVDTRLLTELSLAGTTRVEEALFADLLPEPIGSGGAMMMSGEGAMMAGPAMTSGDGGANWQGSVAPLAALEQATHWLNADPITVEDLAGKVVLIDFWTYSCINCLRTLPYVSAWAEKYADDGLVVIGVHSPEFAFEKDLGNVRRAVGRLGITYPVAVDNDFAVWRAFANRYWPAHYFIDATGTVRHQRFGEGAYDVSERVIQELLAEAGQANINDDLVAIAPGGEALAADRLGVLSPETYLGHQRAESFASPGGLVPDVDHAYSVPDRLGLNEWALEGTWTVTGERAALVGAPGRIAFRFHARDVNLVLGREGAGEDGGTGSVPVRFRVLIDGVPPGEDHGLDVAADGTGVVTDQRLYQLVRQSVPTGGDRLFEIEFLSEGVGVYAFTFG